MWLPTSGQFDAYSHELAQFERSILKDVWPGF